MPKQKFSITNPQIVASPHAIQIPYFRIEGEMAAAVAQMARKYNVTQSAFIRACIKYALDNMEK